MADRTVHASHPLVGEIVRYDRAGRWYVEWTAGGRQCVGVMDAARIAAQWESKGGAIFLGRPGSATFTLLIHTERHRVVQQALGR